MANKMMITGKVTKTPEHIELNRFWVTVETAGGKEIVVIVDGAGLDGRLSVGTVVSFLAVMDGEDIVAESVSYKR